MAAGNQEESMGPVEKLQNWRRKFHIAPSITRRLRHPGLRKRKPQSDASVLVSLLDYCSGLLNGLPAFIPHLISTPQRHQRRVSKGKLDRGVALIKWLEWFSFFFPPQTVQTPLQRAQWLLSELS